MEIGKFIAQTERIHFYTLYSLGYLWICLLHQCNICSRFGLAVNLSNVCADSALIDLVRKGFAYSFVEIGAFIAQTAGIYFYTLYSLGFLVSDPKHLQKLIDKTTAWCSENDVLINAEKTKIMHFRHKRRKQHLYHFYYNDQVLDYCSEYKYL